MEDTWTTTDLPVLEAAVQILEESYDDAAVPTAAHVVELTGFDARTVLRSLDRLRDGFVNLDIGLPTAPEYIILTGVTAAARRAVGQWPSPEGLLRRLIDEFERAADQETIQKTRASSRARHVSLPMLDGTSGSPSPAEHSAIPPDSSGPA